MDKALHSFIVMQLGWRHISQTAIAKAAGYTPSFVNQVIMGKKKSERVQEVLSLALGFASWAELTKAAYSFQRLVCLSSRKEA